MRGGWASAGGILDRGDFLPGTWGRVPGFTLVELLAVVAVVGILAAIILASVGGVQRRAHGLECAARMRALGMAVQLYTQDHNGEFPRSFHSAGAHREPGWAASAAPYLGAGAATSLTQWKPIFNRYFRCPEERSTDATVYSYGLNVHFELDPSGDNYRGSPATWRRIAQVPAPSRTILLAETPPIAFGDHFMCHQWSGAGAARNAVAHARHEGKSNYLFVDGHVETLTVEETIDTGGGVNLWNPSLAQ